MHQRFCSGSIGPGSTITDIPPITSHDLARTRVSAPHRTLMSTLQRKYEYRRRLPHFQKPGRPVFVTFRKLMLEPFSHRERDLVLKHCFHDHGKTIQLHAAVVMPTHVHLVFTPLRDQEGWPYQLRFILKQLKGCSARSINKLLDCSGVPVWQDESFDHVLRSNESLAEKIEYIRQNPVRAGLVHTPQDYPWLWVEP
jgi:REP element-mobilizing transposase RayT